MYYAEPPKIDAVGYANDDCTIIAMGNGLGVSYDLAKCVMQNLKDNQGNYGVRIKKRTKDEIQDTLEAYRLSNLMSSEVIDFERKVKRKEIKRLPTVDKFTEDYPTGTYLVFIEGHMLAVIGGHAVDVDNSSWERVERAYKVDFEKADEILMMLCNRFNLDPEIHILKEICHYEFL